jgi:hypothetical protein
LPSKRGESDSSDGDKNVKIAMTVKKPKKVNTKNKFGEIIDISGIKFHPSKSVELIKPLLEESQKLKLRKM